MADRMPRLEPCSLPAPRSLARAEKQAREARERSVRAGVGGRPAAGAHHARAGLRHLGWTEDGDRPDAQRVHEAHRALAARLLAFLAIMESEQGRPQYALQLLDRAAALAPAENRGLLLQQRGYIFLRTGRDNDALNALSGAIALLEGDPAETRNLVAVLLNRSFAHLNRGEVGPARRDLTRCRQVAAGLGNEFGELHVAKALHNLGCCDLLAGDIPAALQLFTAAADGFRRIAPTHLPVVAMDKARALLAAGLAGDAAAEMDGAIAAFRQQRLDQDLAEAELARSEAALAAGEPAVSWHWAAAARRRFLRHGNDASACLAELTRLRARSTAPGRQAMIAAEAARLAGRLHALGLANDAEMAGLLAARALLAAGRLEEARQRLAGLRGRRAPMPLAVRLLRRLAQAELAEREGRPGSALAELRAGLALVRTWRGRLGSVDLQTGTAALGADLAAAGLRLALQRDSAPLAFAWLERSRAQAFLVRPVRPPAEPQAADLAELRQLSYLIREAELRGKRDPRLMARRAELQRELRERDWQASGSGRPTALSSLGDVSAALYDSGQTLVSILARRGRMLAIVIRRGSVRLVELGDFATAAEAARRLNADLDTQAGRLLPTRLQAVIRESIRHQTQLLTTEIVEPLRPWLGDDGVVFVPTGDLAGIPWSVLPDLRGRPVTVSPSASAWLTAWRSGRAAAGQPPPGPPLLVAGPDLEHAAREVSEIARFYPGCRPLLAEAATVGAALQALDGAPLAHLVAHGHHEQGNFLFSRLDLADGPLMAYDIQRLAAAPRQVVLSSCDVGRIVTRPGEEILGFSAALLYIGTETVISSVTRVDDADAVSLMTEYHRLLTAGMRPAEALAEASCAGQFSPFVCFGGG